MQACRRFARLALVAGIAVLACSVARPGAIGADRGALELAVWPPDSGVVVELAPLARAQIDTIIAETRATRIEQAWCATEFRLRTERGREHIAIDRLERSPNVARADSVTIWTSRPLCDDETPGLHSHVVWASGWLYFPSPTDLGTAAQRSAPFHLLLSAGDGRVYRLTVYAVRRP